MRVWTPEDYGGPAGIGAIVQHPRSGFIYAVNGVRILEFDGVRWRPYGGPGGTSITALAVDARGRVWFASLNDVGYLAPDGRGELQIVSAKPRLPSDAPSTFGFGAVLAREDGVYFVNRDQVVRFPLDDSSARVWRFDEPLAARIWWQDDAVHVRGQRDALRLSEGEFRPVPGLRTAALAGRAVSAGGWQLLNNDGVRRWDRGYKSIVTGQLRGDFAVCATFLDDGRIAFGTTRNGVIVCDAEGRAQHVINQARGLPATRVASLCADRQGGLWVGLRNAVVRLQLDSPLSRHGVGLNRADSVPSALALHREQLYVAGGEGLWRRDPTGNFHVVADVPFQLRNLYSHGDDLFLTGVELRRVGADDRAQPLAEATYGIVAISTAPGHFAQGSGNGLVLARSEGRWLTLGRHEKISGMTTALCEWPAGVLWASSAAGIWRIDFRAAVQTSAPARVYTPADGLPSGVGPNNVGLIGWHGGLAGMVGARLMRFDESADRFLPETRIAGVPLDRLGFGLAAAAPAADGGLWLQLYQSAAAIGRAVPVGPNRWRLAPAQQPELTRLRTHALLEDAACHTLWIATAAGLVSRDLDWKPGAAPVPFVAAIRRVETADGKLIWADGNTFVGGSTEGAAAANRSPALRLAADQNDLQVSFAAATFPGDHAGRVHTLFRTRLDGLDTRWSAWRAQASREFTNLPYRDFRLRVQARDEAGRDSAVATLAFSVAPPWWLTRWAYGGYGVLALLGVAGLVRWRTRTLQRRAERLEAVVASRTEELRRSNAELARLHAVERDEKLAARLAEEKARLEVLRYQLNPHFLFNALNSVCASINHAPSAARGMVVRIADFCRQTLHRPGTEEAATTVGQELTMLRAYLDIEKMRLGELLHLEIESDPAAEHVRMPPFLLLPLVENAIKYGTATSVDEVGIRVSVRREDDGAVAIEVANTGEWLEPGAHSAPSTGIGLENLRQRLARYYPRAHELSTSSEGGWVIVRVRLLHAMRETVSAV